MDEVVDQPAGSQVRSRRAFLFGGVAATTALVAEAIARARPAVAADGDPILIGDGTNSGTAATILTTSVADDGGLSVVATGQGAAALSGSVSSSVNEPAGVFGEATNMTGLSHGVFGRDASTGGVGVTGRSTAAVGSGIGVSGRAVSLTGVGVHAQGGQDASAGEGIALQALGQVRFSTSGIATVAKGAKQVIVNPGVPITTASRVLCTLLSNPGGTTTVQRVSRNTTADVFTIVLTAKATAATKVGWFLISGS
jgi:hypothetical protein